MPGSPLRLNASAPALAGSRENVLRSPDSGAFVRHFYVLGLPLRRLRILTNGTSDIVCDGHCCPLHGLAAGVDTICVIH